ncbi:uncharacterized protein LTHEOB_2981 [Lasiodiplodia theobromae]|uniref:uncharacterized protein n=1 Tax=Lasiodiplodia theobromae TaxID=45133 RepID=UPI0015C35692|nr:uncharacterized protein LTHEOB_2981 [Lasiodiplodia theobromae]KAF4535006.1 hypothetical protein LTHEOB_2981 [Lasiodiplodia theobromae]
MDPLSSLGVAGNVIQFVDFSIRLVSKFNQIYRSADGALQENSELSEIATRLKSIAGPLKERARGADPELRKIAQRCCDASNELLEVLEGLRNQANQHRKLSAVRITLKSVMKEGVIRDLDSKLQRLQQQLNTSLLALLHGSNGLLTMQIAEIIDANQKFRLETRVTLDELIRRLEKFQKLGHRVIYLPEIGQQIGALTEESKLADKRRRILQSLRYNIMYDRFEDVVEAYESTFQWVLNDPDLGFSDWLKSPSARTFWITGKPGSGKSTLMKYIHQHPKTRESLREWAGSDRLVIVNHFFWVSGDPLQRRQIGLLRSLLFQILRECPHLVARVCESRWNKDKLTWDEPWNLRALSLCFQRLANEETLDAKICLFIDGLDEYDGDHRELIRLLRNLITSSESQPFKLCVSSRPWNVFEAEYGGLEDKLNVHELTSEDILLYVYRNLREDQYLNEMFTAEDDQCLDIIYMITKKAQGVFLWVYYVVRLLLQTAVDYPTMSDLIKMVDGYPDELDQLFERILAGIPKVYHRDTAQMIKICLASTFPPLLVFLSFTERGIENEDYALQQKIAELTNDDLKNIQRFKQRLKGRCMDFVDVHCNLSIQKFNVPNLYLYQVDFFHRTGEPCVLQDSTTISICGGQ